MMTPSEIKEWASAYIRAQQAPDLLKEDGEHPLWWAVERFMPPFPEPAHAEDCWAAILEVLAQEPPPEVVSVLAAGPLEDLIEYFGAEFIERIEAEARGNPRFRHLLGGVWQSCSAEVWGRVELARGKAW